MQSGTPTRHRVWDLPSRLSHAAIAVLVLAQFASGLLEWLPMSWHLWCGYALLAVLLFRVIWGLIGSDSARFSHFLSGPGAVLRYARALVSSQPSHWPGHNPVGGWSVVVLLALALTQSLSGLVAGARDDFSGPLAHRVSRSLADSLGDLHESLYWFLLLAVILHIAAAAFYLLHKDENLIGPMFGDGRLPLPRDPGLRFASNRRALILFTLCVAAVVAVASLGET